MPANSGKSAWPSNDDFTAVSMGIIVIAGGFFGWLAWHRYHAIISAVVAVVAHWQIVLIHHFTPALNQLDTMVQTANPETVTIRDVLSVLNATGHYLRIPAIILIVAVAIPCFMFAAPSRFTRNLDLDGLIREQALSFRSIAAFAGRNLKLVPLIPDAVRPADPALHASEWASRFAKTADGAFDEDAATRAFAAQLNGAWAGSSKAPAHVRVMFAVFALHLQQERIKAQDLLGRFAEALPQGGAREVAGPAKPYLLPAELIAVADQILQSEATRQPAEDIAARHAFTAPALMSLVVEARRRAGVLAPAQFAGLKLVDRSLWYALHSLGFEGDGPGQKAHPNPRIEAAGSRDHWAAERILGRPLTVPNVARAIAALRAAIGQTVPVANQSEAS